MGTPPLPAGATTAPTATLPPLPSGAVPAPPAGATTQPVSNAAPPLPPLPVGATASQGSGSDDYQAFDPTPPPARIAKYTPWVADAAKRYNVPAWAITAIIGQETGRDTDYRTRESARNADSGALGIGQFMPDTAAGWGIDPLKPDQAIRGIAMGLAAVKKKYPNLDWATAAAYRDTSPTVFDSHLAKGTPLPTETQRYLANMRLAQSKAQQAVAAQQPAAVAHAVSRGNAAGAVPRPQANAPPLPAGAQVPPFQPQALAAPIALVASSIGNALDFQRWAAHGLATAAARGGMDKGTWDPDTQRAEQRQLIPGLDTQYHEGGYHFGAPVPVMGPGGSVIMVDLDKLQDLGNQAGRGIIDTALDTALDPLTYETLGAGALLKQLGPKLAVQTMRAINASPLGRWIYDQLHWGGEIARTRGTAMADTVRGASLQSKAEGARLQAHMQNRFDAIVKPLDDPEKVRVSQALNGELDPKELTPQGQLAFRQLRTLTMMDYHLRRQTVLTIALRNNARDLAPAERQQLAAAIKASKRPAQPGVLQQRYDSIQSIVNENTPQRENYMPFKHGAQDAEGRESFVSDPTEVYDPRFEHRDDFHVDNVNQLQDGFKAMALNANRQRSFKVINDALGDLLDDPAVKRALQQTIPATGNKRDDWQKVVDGWRAVVGYPRAGVVSMTPRHAVNILDLLVNTVPLQEQPRVMRETMQLAARLFEADPKTYAALTKEGRDLGAISGNFAERKAFFHGVPVLGSISSVNNKLVWAVDDAAKQIYAKMLARTGEASGLQAGGMAARRLVDYENLSNLQKALRYVAPFGTFRGGIPGAVLGGVARNPMRAAVINRLTGGRFYGDKPESGEEGAYYLGPTAEVGRGVTWGTDQNDEPSSIPQSGPFKFAESSLADPAADLVGMFKSRTPLTTNGYGKTWLPSTNDDGTWNLGVLANQALAGIPEAQTLLNAMGIGQFQWRGLAAEAARQTTGVMLQPASP